MRPWSLLTALTLVVSVLLLSAVPTLDVYGHNGDVLNAAWASTAPAIDGTIIQEWNGDVVNIPTKTYLRDYDASMSVTAENDDKYFYLNIQVFPPEDITVRAQNYRLLALYIDSNHDGVLTEGADLVVATGTPDHYVGPYSGSHYQAFAESVGWTGDGWIYEARIPFTLDNGYNWAKPGDSLGLAIDWIIYDSNHSGCNWNGCFSLYYGVEQIIVPSASVYHYTDSRVQDPGMKTSVPTRFMDIILAGSSTDRQSLITSTGTQTLGAQGTEGTNQIAIVNQSDLSLGTYLAIGIAVAGGAVAGAIVFTRRKSGAGVSKA